MSELINCEIVELDYNDLIADKDLTEQIRKAYGFDGVGLLTVKNVPNYVEARKKLLPLSKKFADLPDEVKNKYVLAESYYSFGWSHGKEKLQGMPDYSKGSYYGNPQYDRPVEDEELIKNWAPFVHPNIWPKEDLPELEFAFKELGQIIVSVGKLIGRQCDRYVLSCCPTYNPPNKLENVIDKSLCCKARLLHYFAIDQETAEREKSKDNEFSSWCGWHNDHGSLTGLTCAMYMDENGNEVENTDKTAGKYFSSRYINYYMIILYCNCLFFLFFHLSFRFICAQSQESADTCVYSRQQHCVPNWRNGSSSFWWILAGTVSVSLCVTPILMIISRIN